MNDLITQDGEVIESDALALVDATMASALARADLDVQITTARRFPRSITKATSNILTLATMDEGTAEECIYALKRDGKAIRGPSIRLAEIIGQQWGNNRASAQIVSIDRDNKMIVAEGIFHDLESNSAVKTTVQRRISKRDGKIYSDDMINVVSAAACSIARRNAILAGVPKGVWRKALEAAEQIIRGDVKTLTERRDAAIKAFAHFGISPDQIFGVLGIKGIDDVDLDALVDLRGMFSALKNGELTVEELLRGSKAEPQHKIVANPLADAAPEPQDAPQPGQTVQDQQETPAHQKPAQEPETASQADLIALARSRGVEAKAAGMARKALPGEYREPGREAEAKAWGEGYDEKPAE